MAKDRTRSKLRNNDLSTLVSIIAVVLLVNIVTQNIFFRIDLTSEKRYTLSKSTKDILRDLDDIVFIRVYLEVLLV